MRAALYSRVSSDEQARDGFSLSAQDHRLKAYTEAQGWTVAGLFQDDGYTGRNVNRPGYQAMMAAKDSWDTILVLKMDRAHRSSKHFMAMMEELQKDGKEFASVTEALDTSTAMGRFFADLLQRVAQLESEVIGERTLVGMTEKARIGGGSLGAPTPYGYKRHDGKLYPSTPLEVETVRTIFRLARAGMDFQAIAKALQKLHPESGRTWTRFQVRRAVRNPVYAGCLVWNGILQCGQHEALVPRDLWEAVQERHETGVRIS